MRMDDKNETSLDEQLRNAVAPVLDLEDDEMLADIIVIFTRQTPDGECFSYRASDYLTIWKAKGLAMHFIDVMESEIEDEDD